jgi:hypothetical protein
MEGGEGESTTWTKMDLFLEKCKLLKMPSISYEKRNISQFIL